VGITVGDGHFSAVRISGLFVLAYLGGALSGLLTAWLGVVARRHLDDPVLENVVSVLTPFAAFLGAEAIHASGVLAVVVCGLTLSQVGPRLVRADTRQQAQAFWGLSVFILNGSLFVLVGLQANASVRGLTTVGVGRALLMTLAIGGAVIATRVVWSFTVVYVIRTVDRRPQQRLRRVGARQRVVNTLAGFRGAVSLAAALAVPETVRGGAPFPDRDVIVFVVSGVIVITLLQGLILPSVVRWSHTPPDNAVLEERRLAETIAAEEALASLPDVAERLGTAEAVVARTRKEYEKHLAILRTDGEEVDEEDPNRRAMADYTALRLEMLGQKRATVVRLRDERLIDDTVLRQIQTRLDVEEVRLSRREPVE
jgi:monovalent cation/hydrogen antiporter